MTFLGNILFWVPFMQTLTSFKNSSYNFVLKFYFTLGEPHPKAKITPPQCSVHWKKVPSHKVQC